MGERIEFVPCQADPEREVKYWAGAFDSYHGSIHIDYYMPSPDSKGHMTPGLPNFKLMVRLPAVNGLNYPALLRQQFGSSAYLSDGRWEISSRKALVFLQRVEPHLIIKKGHATLGIEFQKETAITNKLPPSERIAHRLTIGETYHPEMADLNLVNLYDQSRFNVPDKLDPAYVIGMMEYGLRPTEDPRRVGRIKGLSLEWRSKKAAERVQDYFGGSVVDITRAGFRNTWGIEDTRELLAKVQPYFKLRYIVDFEKPFMFNPILRKLFSDYHRLIVNLAIASVHPHTSSKHPGQEASLIDQTARMAFIYGYVAGMKQCLDEFGLAEYTERSQQQAEEIAPDLARKLR